jgi:5-methylcytosine-specific restriction protein A
MTMTHSESEAFTRFLQDKALEAQKALNYRPSYFLQMLGSVGGYQTVVALISQPNPSDGFAKLWEAGRLDLSVEALVLESRWRHHFDEQLVNAAFKRLSAVGYEPKSSNQSEGAQSVQPSLPKSEIPLETAITQTQSPTLPFILAEQYSRSSIFKVLKLNPEPKGGNWFTGYVEHEGNFFIFCNIGVGGRTGHDYPNHFDGDRLVWFGKGPSKLESGLIQRLLKPQSNIYIFYRFDDRDLFTFAGTGRPHEVFNTAPVKVVWDFSPLRTPFDGTEHPTSQIDLGSVVEGAAKTVMTKVYERDRGARLKCIGHWGWECFVCQFDFAEVYGDLGEGFIHVHHLKPLSEIGKAYMLDPITDLRPVCPNCHAMLHRYIPALTIEDLQARMHRVKTESPTVP